MDCQEEQLRKWYATNDVCESEKKKPRGPRYLSVINLEMAFVVKNCFLLKRGSITHDYVFCQTNKNTQ